MCNPTKQPPRRDMYELETNLTANTGGFLVPANRRIRIGESNTETKPIIYNANYMSDGTRYADFDRPWTVFTPCNFRAFNTHAEAITWADQQARNAA